MVEKRIYLGADHAGFKLKEIIQKWLEKNQIPYGDGGAYKLDITDDYPDFAVKVCRQVVKNKSRGILFCGSAEGMCIAANKIKGIRAVTPQNWRAAKLTREHNDANVLCLAGGSTLNKIKGLGMPSGKAERIIKVWLETPFSDEPRHLRRLKKIKKLER